MRTTVDLTEDAYNLAKAYADANRVSLGRAVSEMIVREKTESYSAVSEAGFPLFRTHKVITAEIVSDILNED